jgi:hypothetical protein
MCCDWPSQDDEGENEQDGDGEDNMFGRWRALALMIQLAK